MHLTSEQNAALLACGYQVLPATPWQIWHLSQQRRIFVLGDRSVVVQRHDGFLETYGTLGLLLEQHAEAQALARVAAATSRLPEVQAEVAQAPVPRSEPASSTGGSVTPRNRPAAPHKAVEHQQELAGPCPPATKTRPDSKLVQHRDAAESSAAAESAAALDQAKVDLLAEFESKASALGLSVARVMEDRAAASGHSAPERKRREGEPGRAKYRGPEGQEWSGRGRRPAWIAAHEAAGRNRDEFLVR